MSAEWSAESEDQIECRELGRRKGKEREVREDRESDRNLAVEKEQEERWETAQERAC